MIIESPPLVLSASWMIFAFIVEIFFFLGGGLVYSFPFFIHIHLGTYLFDHRKPPLGPIRVLDDVRLRIEFSIPLFIYFWYCSYTAYLLFIHTHIHIHTCLIIVGPPLVLSASWMIFASQLFSFWCSGNIIIFRTAGAWHTCLFHTHIYTHAYIPA